MTPLGRSGSSQARATLYLVTSIEWNKAMDDGAIGENKQTKFFLKSLLQEEKIVVSVSNFLLLEKSAKDYLVFLPIPIVFFPQTKAHHTPFL